MDNLVFQGSLFFLGLTAFLIGKLPLTPRRRVTGSAARTVGVLLMIPLPFFLLVCKQIQVSPLGPDPRNLDPMVLVNESFVRLTSFAAGFGCLLMATVLAAITSEKRRRGAPAASTRSQPLSDQPEARSTPAPGNLPRNVSKGERRDAEETGKLVRKKLLQIMDLQADMDVLLRDKHPSPFGSQKWQDASLDALQRLVVMTAIQFILFEPMDWVKGNDEFKVAADRIIEIILAQLKTLKTGKSDRLPK